MTFTLQEMFGSFLVGIVVAVLVVGFSGAMILNRLAQTWHKRNRNDQGGAP